MNTIEDIRTECIEEQSLELHRAWAEIDELKAALRELIPYVDCENISDRICKLIETPCRACGDPSINGICNSCCAIENGS